MGSSWRAKKLIGDRGASLVAISLLEHSLWLSMYVHAALIGIRPAPLGCHAPLAREARYFLRTARELMVMVGFFETIASSALTFLTSGPGRRRARGGAGRGAGGGGAGAGGGGGRGPGR